MHASVPDLPEMAYNGSGSHDGSRSRLEDKNNAWNKTTWVVSKVVLIELNPWMTQMSSRQVMSTDVNQLN